MGVPFILERERTREHESMKSTCWTEKGTARLSEAYESLSSVSLAFWQFYFESLALKAPQKRFPLSMCAFCHILLTFFLSFTLLQLSEVKRFKPTFF